LPNLVLDQERVTFLKARTVSRKMLVPAWPRSDKELSMVEVEVDWVRFSTLNHRTKAEQLRAIHLRKQPELFTADPLGGEAQTAQYEILRSQEGFENLKKDLRERRQQDPAILTAEGVLINGNRRSAALRSLYQDENFLEARYVQCLVLPDDATVAELVDLEAELQVAQDFKEEYSWVNEAMLIEELYEREQKDFSRVAKKMHRDLSDVKGMYEKLQQLHQLVALSKGTRLHIDFNDNASAFEELAKHIKGKTPVEVESVRSTYLLGTLVGVKYRTLRHLQRADAAALVRREIETNQGLQPLLEVLKPVDEPDGSTDPLDDFLGPKAQSAGLNDILGLLAVKTEDEVIKMPGGENVPVVDVFNTVRGAIIAAADEAEEEAKDQSAVIAPVVRLEKALSEMKRAISSLPKARAFDGWNEERLQKLVSELNTLVPQLTPSAHD
jgi:hypothetical protein